MITFINRFEVHGPAAEFERAFDRTARFFAAQPGFIRHRLIRHRETPDRYVNIADWRDIESFRRALDQPEFAPHAAALRALCSSDPNLYNPVMERTAESSGDRSAV
jgi:heme-degrading monooxygenase HmoA